MSKTPDPHVEKLRTLVEGAGGPAEFARKYSQDGADRPIDPTYVSQLLNGHRAFRDKARKNMALRAGLPENYFDVWQGEAQPAAAHNPWPTLVTQIADIARDLPGRSQQELLGQAKLLQAQHRVASATPLERYTLEAQRLLEQLASDVDRDKALHALAVVAAELQPAPEANGQRPGEADGQSATPPPRRH